MSQQGRKCSLSGPVGTPKKKKYGCKYQIEWQSTYDWVQPSSLEDDMAFCKLCSSNISVASGALYDVKRHSNSVGHKKAVDAQKSSKSIANFIPKAKAELEHCTIVAETLFANFIAEHNIPFSVADHFSELSYKMFPDSEIAAKFACKKTKCTQIVKRAIAPSLYDEVIKNCQENAFSILCDESTDRGTDKCFAIMVRVLDVATYSVKTRFLEMPVVNIT